MVEKKISQKYDKEVILITNSYTMISPSELYKPIGITWWPCGGKSSIIPLLVETLLERDYTVHTIQEMATYLESMGIHPKYGTPWIEFQKHIINFQLLHEEAVQKQMQHNGNKKKSVILCDRWLIDNLAYVDIATYKPLIAHHGLTIDDIYTRYAATIHLQSAAYGAEAFYTCENNKARSETLEEARIMEDKILEAYDDFPGKTYFIGNRNPETGESISFDQKKQNAKNALLSLLGDPAIEYERRFDVQSYDHNQLLSYNPRLFHIEQHYLPTNLFARTDIDEARVRCLQPEWSNQTFYFLTFKKRQQWDQRIEEEKEISKDTYYSYLAKKDPQKSWIFKTRYVFRNPLDNHRYEFDIFKNEQWQQSGKYKLEVELPSKDIWILLPAFIKNYKEVTGDKAFWNAFI